MSYVDLIQCFGKFVQTKILLRLLYQNTVFNKLGILHRPELTEEEGKRLESALKKHKIAIPEFKKPHWQDLKLIPKDQRPKPPKLK